MEIFKLFSDSLEGRYVAQAVETLREGELIIYPTDTLYALGCDALNRRAVERLCRIKGLDPDKNYLSMVCADISQAAEYARIDNLAFKIIKEHTPGPFTFVLPISTKLPKIFKGRRTVGVRIPDSIIARTIAERLGNPLTTTSIDFDSDYSDSAIDPAIIAERYENDAAIMIENGDGLTIPSTVIDLTDSSNPTIIRQGAAIPTI